jgi:hypothetical protein
MVWVGMSRGRFVGGRNVKVPLLFIAGHNRRWMDRYQYYLSILLVMLTTDSIDPSVKDFFLDR